ncbi:DUF3306 domain-containing protein [Massilia sp. IC2-476]|uniref:DUF3306 domain-containing protein n=1 Tax=Massilia sp. IC2-476 TaxID=2887199 RepID=UPI001D11262E|nr:DUF3306 domain-containing protein [Massilia sp. IC2-476]MCC2973703.1 DUF3306 domain-containing protein [Massilia sp. IC2-476]
MSEEGFLRRWSRLKSTGGEAEPAPPAAVPVAVPEPVAAGPESEATPSAPLPTMDDVARLTPDADFSAFVAKGVDKSVQRLALKKLFTDPHFNAIDGLDMYMNDYNKAAPLPPGMLASLKHAPGVLSRLFEEQPEHPEAAVARELAAEQAAEQGTEPATGQVPPSTQQGNA